MAPRRNKNAELPLKSVWDENSLIPYLPFVKHRNRIWTYLIRHVHIDEEQKLNDKKAVRTLRDVPYRDWCFPIEASNYIAENFSIFTSSIAERHESARGDTTKLIVRLQDGHEVETVVIRHMRHATVCISSQIGCQMGCKFCATGTMGIIGDLTAGEIIEQLIYANAVTKIRNVVFMGMGEPLNNFENVKKAVEFMIDSKRFGLSPKHVTVSTVGVLKNMYRLSDELPNVNLALSLHAPNQEVRMKIVPAARAHNIQKLIEAVDYHIKKNNYDPLDKENLDEDANASQGALMYSSDKYRRGRITGVMIEYILIKEINDLDEHAHELGKLLQPRKDHILLNLIPYNPTDVAEDYHPPTQEQVNRFFNICIREYGIYTRMRQEKGQDIAGACGQLALVRGNNKSGEHAVADVEDYVLQNSTDKNHKKTKKVGVEKKKEVLRDVLRSFEVSSFSPVDDKLDEMKKKAQRCKYMCYANLFIPVGLILLNNLLVSSHKE